MEETKDVVLTENAEESVNESKVINEDATKTEEPIISSEESTESDNEFVDDYSDDDETESGEDVKTSSEQYTISVHPALLTLFTIALLGVLIYATFIAGKASVISNYLENTENVWVPPYAVKDEFYDYYVNGNTDSRCDKHEIHPSSFEAHEHKKQFEVKPAKPDNEEPKQEEVMPNYEPEESRPNYGYEEVPFPNPFITPHVEESPEEDNGEYGINGWDETVPEDNQEEVEQPEQTIPPVVMNIIGRTITPEESDTYNVPVGVYVDSVKPGMAADIAGITEGSIIVSVNNNEVHTIEELRNELNVYRPGDTVEIAAYIPIENSYELHFYKVTLDAGR